MWKYSAIIPNKSNVARIAIAIVEKYNHMREKTELQNIDIEK